MSATSLTVLTQGKPELAELQFQNDCNNRPTFKPQVAMVTYVTGYHFAHHLIIMEMMAWPKTLDLVWQYQVRSLLGKMNRNQTLSLFMVRSESFVVDNYARLFINS